MLPTLSSCQIGVGESRRVSKTQKKGTLIATYYESHLNNLPSELQFMMIASGVEHYNLEDLSKMVRNYCSTAKMSCSDPVVRSSIVALLKLPPSVDPFPSSLHEWLHELDVWCNRLRYPTLAFSRMAENGNIAAMEWLIARMEWNDADDAEFNLDFALYSAAEGGHIAAMKYLIGRGAQDFEEALNRAAAKGRLEAVKYLIIHQNLTYFDDAMANAAAGGHREVIEYLTPKMTTHPPSLSLSGSEAATHTAVHST